MAALPWASGEPPPANDPMLNASVKLALLGAARALTRDAQSSDQEDADDVVSAALVRMTPDERLAAASMLKKTQERIYGALKTIQRDGGDVTAERVLELMNMK